jgi:hypothetical protein
MPSKNYFSVKLLVAGVPLPEYERNGNYYVECCLSTPVSYKSKSSTFTNGETESQVTVHQQSPPSHLSD